MLELFQRVFSSFIDGEYADFTYTNLANVAKQDTIKKNFKAMKDLGIIEDHTTNGYATRIKVVNPLDCPDFLFNPKFNVQTKDYILEKWKEYQQFGRIKVVIASRERIIKKEGTTTLDIVKNAKFIKNTISTNSTAQLVKDERGYRIISKQKPPKCIYCGCEDPSNFGHNKSVCKDCLADLQRDKYTMGQRLFERSSKSARSRGLEYDLDEDYLEDLLDKQKNKCCYSGIEFGNSFEDKLTYPTVDRIDSSKGYIKGNVCLCTWITNTMKNTLTTDQFKDIITKIYNNLDNF